MKDSWMRTRLLGRTRSIRILTMGLLMVATVVAADNVPNMFPFPDPSGTVATLSTSGAIDTSNPFFQSLGTNGRSCSTCHLVNDAFGLSAAAAQAQFASNGGADPLFATVDGANCPTAARGVAENHSLLLNNGLIRVFMPVPTNAQFTISVVHDPYGCALVPDGAGETIVSVYRRPLPSTNLRFLSTVMFDGRETIAPLNNPQTFTHNLVTDLTHQALDATLGHAQAATAPTNQQLSAIVNLELALFSAQQSDQAAGQLDAQGASGGPVTLKSQTFYPGINDPLGGNPTGAAFNPNVFMIFTPWSDLPTSTQDQYTAARESVARGQEIFNTHPLTITAVKGLNDALNQPAIAGTCTTCHDTPNVGNHSLPVPLDIGTSHASGYEKNDQIAAALAQLSVPDLPIFKVKCVDHSSPLFNVVLYTSDLGKAMRSGLCTDIGRGKGPILRGLAARAPYFHNGAGASLMEVVNFYDERFQIGLTDQEKADLEAFLGSL